MRTKETVFRGQEMEQKFDEYPLDEIIYAEICCGGYGGNTWGSHIWLLHGGEVKEMCRLNDYGGGQDGLVNDCSWGQGFYEKLRLSGRFDIIKNEKYRWSFIVKGAKVELPGPCKIRINGNVINTCPLFYDAVATIFGGVK